MHLSPVRVWLFAAGLAIIWIDLWSQLSFQWAAREQYSYGWFVPVIAAVFFWRRWQERPETAGDTGRNRTAALVAIGVLALLPLRIIYEANPDWPGMSWLYSLAVVAITLGLLGLAGGVSWVRHFGFSVAFSLVAVRWPWRFEQGITDTLTAVVTRATVELLAWASIPVVQHGRVLELSSGMVGMDDACSGIRSLQSSIMVTLVLGELYRLRPSKRLLLVGMGFVFALLLNIARTLILCWRASTNGVSAVEEWHDATGMTALLVLLSLLWWLGRRMTPAEAEPAVSESEARTIPAAFGRLGGVTCTCAALLVLTNEGWFRYHEGHRRSDVEWRVRMPSDMASFREVDLTPREQKLLRSDESDCGTWLDPDGSEWLVYFFRWDRDSIASSVIARAHRPEVCLSGSGRKLTRDRGIARYVAGGLELPFRRYTFDDHGRSLYVYYCLWEDGDENLPGIEKLRPIDRVTAAWNGVRSASQRTLEVIITGVVSEEAADKAFSYRLPNLIEFRETAILAEL